MDIIISSRHLDLDGTITGGSTIATNVEPAHIPEDPALTTGCEGCE